MVNISTRAALTGLSAVIGYEISENIFGDRDRLVVQNQNVIFPSDLTESAYISMKFSKYQRRSINETPFFSPVNSIRLPLPKELTDTVSVQYSSQELGPAIGASLDTLAQNRQNSFSQSTFDSITGSIRDIAAVAGAQVARSLLPTTALAGLSSLTGVAINPFQTILFKSPNFKKHRFSWKLIPKNEEESRNIEYIVRLFKYHMLPGVAAPGNAVFFSYPEILEIRIFPKDEYLYKFKPCVVDSISVNYAPNGPSFYRSSSAPTAVEFSMNLQEIEIWTKLDYLQNRTVRDTAPNLRIGL